MDSNEEDRAFTNILQEEDEEEPCATESLATHPQVVGSVGGEFTSSFFVGDFHIISKGIEAERS